ncbi:MAG: hypothetical protein AABY11_03615 [archaeon]
MDSRAQVALEYLLTVAFGIVLSTAAALLAFQVVSIAQTAEARIEQFRQETILSFLGE